MHVDLKVLLMFLITASTHVDLELFINRSIYNTTTVFYNINILTKTQTIETTTVFTALTTVM